MAVYHIHITYAADRVIESRAECVRVHAEKQWRHALLNRPSDWPHFQGPLQWHFGRRYPVSFLRYLQRVYKVSPPLVDTVLDAAAPAFESATEAAVPSGCQL